MALTKNKALLKWIDEMAALTTPDKIVWIDGSEEQAEALRAEACSTGELIKLNPEKLPGCYYHRTAVNDVARVEHRTFICTPTKLEAGPTNNWMEPAEAYSMASKIFRGCMKGRTMYVIPSQWALSARPLRRLA
jgi:phosphoenolpyruvate carboxykinase (GTP)